MATLQLLWLCAAAVVFRKTTSPGTCNGPYLHLLLIDDFSTSQVLLHKSVCLTAGKGSSQNCLLALTHLTLTNKTVLTSVSTNSKS